MGHGFVQISSHLCALDEILLNDEKLAIATLPSTPIILHVAGWDNLYYDFGLPTTRMVFLHTVRGASWSGSISFLKVDCLLAEVQANSEDQKEMLSAIAVGIGTVISPTEGRPLTDTEDVKNVTSSDVSSYYEDEVVERTVIVHFRDFRRETMLALFDNYASNMSSTLPLLDTFRVAVWSDVWFEEIHLWGPLALLKRALPPINIMGNGTLDSQPHSTLARMRKTKHLTIGLVVAVTGPEWLTYDFKNDCLPAMPSAVACLGFILLFTIIFIINSLFFTKASLTARRYTTVYLIVDTIRSRIKGNTSAVPKMLRKFFIEISDSDMDVPLGIQHVTTQGSGGTLLNTQNASAQHGISVGLKTPPDPHMDRSAQALRPWDPGFQRVIAPLILTYRRRPIESLDDELLDHHDEDDDDDDYDDHDYIDDSETDSSDYIWEPRSSKQRKSSLKKALPTCLPGPSAPEPKLPIVRCNGQSTLENPNPAVTSGQIPSFPPSGAFANVFSFRLSCPPYSEFSTPVTPAAVDKAQGYNAYSVLTITMRYSKIRNKDVHVRYFTSSSASYIRLPPSYTPCWTFEPEDLYLHWQGPSNVKVWIWERDGNGKIGGAWRPIQAGYSHPRLPEHQLQVLKSARPTWIMKSTWHKNYRHVEGV
ncbi:uncharacterized protein LACBIDRAFT_328178 [Laccaria bicolor S238N-H82]|uniref:Predicted protein n=1 Tax=Laccaria bicolor (strain S238N-H82 / ATCC MYA-4686) TaxID=486041 RepID=B0DDZ8_LACBS|nr:uncharacterized protein LACBIDRAFT_328178 [Laccaria bicolor S238N-H82]EDR07174.1 predicted protein [Laccaria bicolor S238N-H82]|eukprot:XP_001882105.1 predicted protein [Laccaria bicolor S238N-H82]